MPTVTDTFLENRWMVQPNHANHLGSTHGGNVLKWMDELGAMAAMRFSTESCVTAQMDQVNFKRPIPVGETAVVQAYVYETGRTSVDVRLKVFREDPRTGDRQPTTESFSTYVAVDEDGTPQQVPELTVESELDHDLYEDARTEHDDY